MPKSIYSMYRQQAVSPQDAYSGSANFRSADTRTRRTHLLRNRGAEPKSTDFKESAEEYLIRRNNSRPSPPAIANLSNTPRALNKTTSLDFLDAAFGNSA
jgi:hypothetical protein